MVLVLKNVRLIFQSAKIMKFSSTMNANPPSKTALISRVPSTNATIANQDTISKIINATPLLPLPTALNLKSKSMDNADMLIKIVSSSTKPPIIAKSVPRDIG